VRERVSPGLVLVDSACLYNIYRRFIMNALGQLVQWRGYDWGMGGPGGMMGYGYGMSWMGGIFMIVFWVAVIVAIVFLIRWLLVASRTGGHSLAHGGESALDILKKRYARGEIDKQEFEEKKRELMT
jgi:putative membrane protein